MADRSRPRTPTEDLVAEVWCELLNLDQVDVTDDFFAIGGHSMVAVQAVYQLSERIGVELELESFFDLATVEEVAAELDQLKMRGPAAANLVEGEL